MHYFLLSLPWSCCFLAATTFSSVHTTSNNTTYYLKHYTSGVRNKGKASKVEERKMSAVAP